MLENRLEKESVFYTDTMEVLEISFFNDGVMKSIKVNDCNDHFLS
ncbi:hypothetical protein [Helicobacter labacensis]|nr:hypothetical protein [Helicobacter labacensis]